jgi:hypothetical protein
VKNKASPARRDLPVAQSRRAVRPSLFGTTRVTLCRAPTYRGSKKRLLFERRREREKSRHVRTRVPQRLSPVDTPRVVTWPAAADVVRSERLRKHNSIFLKEMCRTLVHGALLNPPYSQKRLASRSIPSSACLCLGPYETFSQRAIHPSNSASCLQAAIPCCRRSFLSTEALAVATRHVAPTNGSRFMNHQRKPVPGVETFAFCFLAPGAISVPVESGANSVEHGALLN